MPRVHKDWIHPHHLNNVMKFLLETAEIRKTMFHSFHSFHHPFPAMTLRLFFDFQMGRLVVLMVYPTSDFQ